VETVPEIHGFQSYRARIRNPPSNDLNPADNTGYAAVEITPPNEHSVLYLSKRPGNTFRFLQQTLKQDEQFSLRAIIRLGEERFFHQGFENRELPQDDFPAESAYYLENQVLVIETSVLPELAEKTQEALRSFLENRAGGILFIGPPELAPQSLQPLLPARQSELLSPARNEPLDLAIDPVFQEAAGGVLFLPPGPYLPEGTTAATALALARGARVITSTERGNLPVLALQAYGAGRTAYLGTASTWRWQMHSTRGGEQYSLFWRYLLAWLGSGGKPRLETPAGDNIRPVGEPLPLELRVLGSDFLPAADAQVRAHIQGPDGAAMPALTLAPSPYEPGLYTGMMIADKPGEYRVDYEVELPGGESLSRMEFFAATRKGLENEDIAFREGTLKNIARITGGIYASYKNSNDILPLNLAAGLPTLQERVYWTRNGLFLAVLLMVAALEWFLRRRTGLR